MINFIYKTLVVLPYSMYRVSVRFNKSFGIDPNRLETNKSAEMEDFEVVIILILAQALVYLYKFAHNG